eukprot:m.170634 g.170634  ORF g.170634 m.170634 type:complete len:63 (-) comp14798_c0_seq1:169-357(-)
MSPARFHCAKLLGNNNYVNRYQGEVLGKGLTKGALSSSFVIIHHRGVLESRKTSGLGHLLTH